MTTITVISSYKLGAPELKDIASIAKKELGLTGKIVTEIDKSVIAGIKIKGDGRELDLTISGTLSRMGNSLI